MYNNPLDGSSNIFLTGAGGTGKTYAINDYIKNHPNTLLCASTGTAAVNIGGSTAHRLFSIPVPAYGSDPDKVSQSQLKVFAGADAVIIDEISMLRCDAFAFAVSVLKRAEKLYGKKIRLIVSGDFSQLPPIVKKTEEKYFTKYGFDKSGFCFTTRQWRDLKFKTIVLKDVKRQSDTEFIEKLADLRFGDTTCIPYFNSFVQSNIPDDAVFLCGTNAEADRINQEYLESINAPLMAYQASKMGITGQELPCDDIVLLKPGCRVMFTANDQIKTNEITDDISLTGEYTNGLFATVKKALAGSVIVTTEDGREIEVTKHKWSIYKYTVDRTTAILKKDEIGSIEQIPLKVAKAITIHKSQGKTFSRMVLSPKIFAAGQLYVALSRVKSPEGLFLTEPVTEDCLKIDPVVEKFYKNNFTWEVSQAQEKKQKEIEKKQKTKKTTKRKTSSSKSTTRKAKGKSTSSTKKKTASTNRQATKVRKSTTKTKTTSKSRARKNV